MLSKLSLESRVLYLQEDYDKVEDWLRNVPAEFAIDIKREHCRILFSSDFKYDSDARRAANLYVQDQRDKYREFEFNLPLNATYSDVCNEAEHTANFIDEFSRLNKAKPSIVTLLLLSDYLMTRGVYFCRAHKSGFFYLLAKHLDGKESISEDDISKFDCEVEEILGGSVGASAAVEIFNRNSASLDVFRLPKIDFSDVTPETVMLRLVNPLFWKKVFLVLVRRKREMHAIKGGLVNFENGLYVSDETLEKFREQRARNAALLESLTAINEENDEFTLAELAESSVSNPDNRRAELMTRISGFEKIARSAGHVPLFLTITCPSRFHAFKKTASGGVVKNEKHSGETPREAQAYLNKIFSRARAKLHRMAIKPYGFRIAEPHHDGTPHWHLLIFIPSQDKDGVVKVISEYAIKENRSELGDDISPRFKCVEIDWSRGTAAGYVAKYVCKNIDGLKSNGTSIGKNFDDVDAPTAAERVLAWAWCWGNRQFQQLGVAPVTYYREGRRLASNPDAVIESEVIKKAVAAADAGDWVGFIEAIGGVGQRLKDLPIRLHRMLVENKYGETAIGVIQGLVDVKMLDAWLGKQLNDQVDIKSVDETVISVDLEECVEKMPERAKVTGSASWFVRTRFHTWTISFSPPMKIKDPWTRVNNCTDSDVDSEDDHSDRPRLHDFKDDILPMIPPQRASLYASLSVS